LSKYFNIVFKGVLDAIDGGVHDINNIGRRVILPRSFDGSPRDMAGKYQDAMAICKEYGNPTFFITFTANPNWKEVRDSLLPIRSTRFSGKSIPFEIENVNEFIEEWIAW
jgi:hypothetical protein